MGKNANLLADAYCDLIEAKLPIVGKHQRRHLDEIRAIVTTCVKNNSNKLGLEDLYEIYGSPADVANKLAAAMADPESTDDPVRSIFAKSNGAGDNAVKIGMKVLTYEQAQEIMQKIINGENLSPDDFEKFEDANIEDVMHDICDNDNHDDIESHMAEVAAVFERANEMADAGMDVGQIALLNSIPTMALYLGGFGEPNDDMEDFIVPVKFEMQGFVKIRATSVDDAIMTANTYVNKIPAPADATVVPGSMQVCTENDMVGMYTDKYRLNKLAMTPAETDIITPLSKRDEILETCDPDKIMDTILTIMGIDTDELDDCDDECEYNHDDEDYDCRWDKGEPDYDNDDADAYIELDIPCSGKCPECDVPKAFGSCPIMKTCANHDDYTNVNLHVTVTCHENCDNCPVPDFLGECPIIDCNDNDASDEPDYDNESDDGCFFDDIEELPEECQPMTFDDED